MIPIKDYIYLGIILVCSGGFLWYSAHERNIGKAEIKVADQKAVQRQAQLDNEVEVRANVLVTKALIDYKATVDTPISTPSIPILVCRQSRSSSPVPPNGSTPAGSNGSTAIPEESTVPFNPAPAVIQDGRDADAQITLLQDYVKICQQLGKCAK